MKYLSPGCRFPSWKASTNRQPPEAGGTMMRPIRTFGSLCQFSLTTGGPLYGQVIPGVHPEQTPPAKPTYRRSRHPGRPVRTVRGAHPQSPPRERRPALATRHRRRTRRVQSHRQPTPLRPRSERPGRTNRVPGREDRHPPRPYHHATHRVLAMTNQAPSSWQIRASNARCVGRRDTVDESRRPPATRRRATATGVEQLFRTDRRVRRPEE